MLSSYYLKYCHSPMFSLLFCAEKFLEAAALKCKSKDIITMSEHHQLSPDSQWGERCSVKLDILLSRVDKLTGLLFHQSKMQLCILASHRATSTSWYANMTFLTAVRQTAVYSSTKKILTNG